MVKAGNVGRIAPYAVLIILLTVSLGALIYVCQSSRSLLHKQPEQQQKAQKPSPALPAEKPAPPVKPPQEPRATPLPAPSLKASVPLSTREIGSLIETLRRADPFLESDFSRRAGRVAAKLIRAGRPAWDALAAAVESEEDEFARARLNAVLACMRWEFSPHLVFLLKESFVFVGELYTRKAPPRGEWFSTLTKFYRIKDASMLIKTFELKDPAASFYIFDFLERLGPAALKPLLEALFREENPYGAFCVKISLMRVAPRALKELREHAIDPEEKVRAMAVRALGLSSRKEAVPALIRALKDESANVRYNAAVMLSVIPDRRAVAPLVDALKDSDDKIPGAAAHALGVIGDPAAIRPLQEYFCSTRPGARQGGASALAGTGEQCAQVLLTFLKDPDEETRIAAACALAELRSTSTVPGLKKALSDKSEHVRSAAADALGYTGGPGVTEALKKALSDPGVGVRTCATHSLGRLKDPTAADALAAMLKDKDMRVRLAAANVLGEIGGERALEILIEMLGSPELAPLAVSGIKGYGASAAPALMAAMPASSVSVRCQIIGRLAEARVVQAVPLLLDGLGDPEVDIRYCANKALKMITSHETSYKCDVPEAERAKGMEEWRAWWKRHGEKR